MFTTNAILAVYLIVNGVLVAFFGIAGLFMRRESRPSGSWLSTSQQSLSAAQLAYSRTDDSGRSRGCVPAKCLTGTVRSFGLPGQD